jgi:hypothetical protein
MHRLGRELGAVVGADVRRDAAGDEQQQLAAIRMLFDWLVVGQVVPHNPASAVHGPRHSAAKGKTRMPTCEEATALPAGIPTGGLVGLRDRALIGADSDGSRLTFPVRSPAGPAAVRPHVHGARADNGVSFGPCQDTVSGTSHLA